MMGGRVRVTRSRVRMPHRLLGATRADGEHECDHRPRCARHEGLFLGSTSGVDRGAHDRRSEEEPETEGRRHPDEAFRWNGAGDDRVDVRISGAHSTVELTLTRALVCRWASG